jgi:uncharacterized protein YqkB
LRDIYSICRCCWNVATYKWKVHNRKIEIISFVVKFRSSIQLLLPVIQTIVCRCRDFQSAEEKKSAKIKCPLFSQKTQKCHTAEMTGYAVYVRYFGYIFFKSNFHTLAYNNFLKRIMIRSNYIQFF